MISMMSLHFLFLFFFIIRVFGTPPTWLNATQKRARKATTTMSDDLARMYLAHWELIHVDRLCASSLASSSLDRVTRFFLNWTRLVSKCINILHFRRLFPLCGELCKRFKSLKALGK